MNPQSPLEGEIEIRDQSGEAFTPVWNWLLDRQDLSAMEKLVWITLKSYAGCPEIRPTVQTLAKRAGVSIRTAQRCIEVLSRKGLVRAERRYRPDGGFAANRYILLPSARKTEAANPASTPRCHNGTPPGVKMTPTRGVGMTPPQVSDCHHKENIKIIKNNLTAPPTPQKPEESPDEKGTAKAPTSAHPGNAVNAPEAVGVIPDDFKKLVKGTSFQKIGDHFLLALIQKHGPRQVFDSLDVLTAFYKQSSRPVKNPGFLLEKTLVKGFTPPSDYVPYHVRIENERKAKEESEKRRSEAIQKQKAEEEAYKNRIAKFDALPEQDRQQWLERARAKSPTLRNSKYAVRSIAIEMFSNQFEQEAGLFPDSS